MKATKTSTPKTAAIVTIHKPGAMSARGRWGIAAWLHRTANDLVKLGSRYNNTGRFTARYFYASNYKSKP